jgi:hypothetical protein
MNEMFSRIIEEKIIKDAFDDAVNKTLGKGNLGLFKKGSKDRLSQALKSLPINRLLNTKSEKDYDRMYDELLLQFHQKISTHYRDDLGEVGPFGYSARILSQYVKLFALKIFFSLKTPHRILQNMHPILSNEFLSTFSEQGIKRVNELVSSEDYYNRITFYRSLISADSLSENSPLLVMRFGKDY